MNKEIETIFKLPCLLTDCSASVKDLSDMLTTTPVGPVLMQTPRPYVKQKEPVVIDGAVARDDDD